jgi:hypothetical protein
MNSKVLFVACDGTIEVIGDPPLELEQIGDCRRERASSIVPVHIGKRIAFLLLRAIFGERGITAEWTRGWYGPWLCLLYATGETFTHQSRKVCLKWEQERLAEIMEK